MRGAFKARDERAHSVHGRHARQPGRGVRRYARRQGRLPAQRVNVRDTTGAGDAFCAGVAMGLTYGKTMREAVEIGTRLAASVITVSENVCPRFLPRELGLDIDVTD